MIAAWYDQQGPAAEVLRVGEMATAEPGPGDVRVRLSGANPGDIKKRQAWLGSSMAFPHIVPHSDDFPQAAKDTAARDLTAAAAEPTLAVPIGGVHPLTRIAAVHELIEAGKATGRLLVELP
jgi:NADPH:quinone reductase-like Zn-dependent oxidoreductase